MECGWVKENAGLFVKGGLEIVFDTSHYVELYNEEGVRLSEAPIKSLNDMVNFLKENGFS